MRTAVISDVHGNLEALEAVCRDVDRRALDTWICLGDLVGYGPDPTACLARTRSLAVRSVMGNHDAAAVGIIGLEDFTPIAAEACRWTTKQLTPEAKEYLSGLPETFVEDSFLLVHGSPKGHLWDYLMSYSQAVEAWDHTALSDVLVGHSHFQFAAEAGRGIDRPGPAGLAIPLGHARLVLNPGSVGQPRDQDPRAGYAIYDDEARLVTLKRAWYDVTVTQLAMAEVGLPSSLITRLSRGR